MSTASGLAGVQRWLAHQGRDVTIELVCAEHAGPVDGPPGHTLIRLDGCSGELATHELVELLADGSSRVIVRLDGCADPAAARRHLEPTVTLLEAGLVDRLSLMGAGVGADPSPLAGGPGAPVARRTRRRRAAVLDARAMPVSRRALLGLGGIGEGEGPASSAEPRARLIDALRAVATPTTALGALPGPTAGMTAAGCVACGVCVQACPAAALRLADGPVDGSTSISTLLLDPAACTGCERCVELCPTSVLAVAAPVTWDRLLSGDEIPVVTVLTALCARCSVRFPISSGATLCAVCSFRRRNPFGSSLPPGLAPLEAGPPAP